MKKEFEKSIEQGYKELFDPIAEYESNADFELRKRNTPKYKPKRLSHENI